MVTTDAGINIKKNEDSVRKQIMPDPAAKILQAYALNRRLKKVGALSIKQVLDNTTPTRIHPGMRTISNSFLSHNKPESKQKQ